MKKPKELVKLNITELSNLLECINTELCTIEKNSKQTGQDYKEDEYYKEIVKLHNKIGDAYSKLYSTYYDKEIEDDE